MTIDAEGLIKVFPRTQSEIHIQEIVAKAVVRFLLDQAAAFLKLRLPELSLVNPATSFLITLKSGFATQASVTYTM